MKESPTPKGEKNCENSPEGGKKNQEQIPIGAADFHPSSVQQSLLKMFLHHQHRLLRSSWPYRALPDVIPDTFCAHTQTSLQPLHTHFEFH